MSRSSAEAQLRAAVVARLRELMPDARIVHELNVAGQGTNRIDVAAISARTIVGVEIKSEKDTLKRLSDQWAAFTTCCHLVVVAAHEKHFKEARGEWRADVPSVYVLNHPEFVDLYGGRRQIWRYPRQPLGHWPTERVWTFCPTRDTQRQPAARDMLEMLWADELRTECARHGLAAGTRRTRPEMVADMIWMMTGREVCHAVCRQLRARQFAEADAPIYPEAKAA